MTEDKPLRVNYEDLDILEDYRHTYDGKLFTGIAYEGDGAGPVVSEDTFADGVLDGACREFYSSGSLKVEEQVSGGALHGMCRSWYENGQLQSEQIYERGRLIKERTWSRTGKLTKDW